MSDIAKIRRLSEQDCRYAEKVCEKALQETRRRGRPDHTNWLRCDQRRSRFVNARSRLMLYPNTELTNLGLLPGDLEWVAAKSVTHLPAGLVLNKKINHFYALGHELSTLLRKED